MPMMEDELVQSHDVPPSDIECFRMCESSSTSSSSPEPDDKNKPADAVYTKFMKPKALNSNDAIVALNEDLKQKPLFGDKARANDVATFEFPFTGFTKDQAEAMQPELESIVANILDIPPKDVDSVITNDMGHALVDFFVQ